jgi:hypothetical protein
MSTERSKPSTRAIQEIASEMDHSIAAAEQGIVSTAQPEHLSQFPWNWTHIDALVNDKAESLTVPDSLTLEESMFVAQVGDDRDNDLVESESEAMIVASLKSAKSSNEALDMLRTFDQYEMDPMTHGQYFTRYVSITY